MAQEITLTLIEHSVSDRGRKFKYKTLKGAQKKAHDLVGRFPKHDPDGYAVSRLSGHCLFFLGTTFEELFSGVDQS